MAEKGNKTYMYDPEKVFKLSKVVLKNILNVIDVSILIEN